MKFYGVGTRFGGNQPFLEDCLEYNFWCMGDSDLKYQSVYDSVEIGDCLIAKSYYPIKQTHEAVLKIEAIGLVLNKDSSLEVPPEYRTSDKYGFTVLWIKRFNPPIKFSSMDNTLGGLKTNTIYEEKDKDILSKIIKLMKYDYKGER